MTTELKDLRSRRRNLEESYRLGENMRYQSYQMTQELKQAPEMSKDPYSSRRYGL